MAKYRYNGRKPKAKPAGMLSNEQLDTLPSKIVMRESTRGGSRTSIRFDFASVTDFVAARDMCSAQFAGISEYESGWTRRWSDMRDQFLTGAGYAHIADQIQAEVSTMSASATVQPSWTMAPAGAYPIVPAAIGGDPFNMRSRTQTMSQAAPVRIFIPLQCSAGVTSDEYANMLAKIVSAIRALSEVRPVELVAYASLDADNYRGEYVSAVFVTCPVEYRFADFAYLASWCESSIGRTAVMGLVHCAGTGYSGGWPFHCYPSDADTITEYKRHLDAGDDDVLIPPPCKLADFDEATKRVTELLQASGVTINL